jgi:hypothetical protein
MTPCDDLSPGGGMPPAKPYAYGGSQRHVVPDEATAARRATTAARNGAAQRAGAEKRLAVYTALRNAGRSAKDAAADMHVGKQTAARYERAYRDAKAGGPGGTDAAGAGDVA